MIHLSCILVQKLHPLVCCPIQELGAVPFGTWFVVLL